MSVLAASTKHTAGMEVGFNTYLSKAFVNSPEKMSCSDREYLFSVLGR